MYICLCKGVTENQIKDEVLNGANNLKTVKERLGVASQCAKCAQCASKLIKEIQQIK